MLNFLAFRTYDVKSLLMFGVPNVNYLAHQMLVLLALGFVHLSWQIDWMHNIASFAQQSNHTGAPDSSCPSVYNVLCFLKKKKSVVCYCVTRGKITNLVNIPTFYVRVGK